MGQVSHNWADNEVSQFLTKARSQIYEYLEVSIYLFFWLPLTALTQGGARPSGLWDGARAGIPTQGFPPDTEHGVRRAYGYSSTAGEGLPGCPVPGTDICAIMLTYHAALIEQVHEAIFSFHPTNLNKLNYNYGGSRKPYVPITTMWASKSIMFFPSLNGRQGISLE